jgi:hypothetical protein
MHQTRRELLDEFVRFVGDDADPTALSIAGAALQRAMTTIWLDRPWSLYRSPVPITLRLVVNQARYSLPDWFGRIGPGEVRNVSLGGQPLPRLADGQLEEDYPTAGTDFEVAGRPRRYELVGVSGVHTQPLVTGEALEVVSSSTEDVAVRCLLAGTDAQGVWSRRQVTLSGATAVPIGTWGFVDEFGKAYPEGTDPDTVLSSAGTVTLRKVADATELQALLPQEAAREHRIFMVYPKPSIADVLTIPVVRKVKRLLYDADPLPEDWIPALWEEMGIEWQVNLGELSRAQASAAPRPKLAQLIGYENQQQPAIRKKPFGGRA